MPNHYLKCHCKDFVRCQYKLSTCHILLSNIFRSVYLWKCFSEFALKNGGFHQMVQVQRKAQLNPTTELLNTVNWKVGLTQKKKMQKCHYCFKHPYEKRDWPFKSFTFLCLASQDIWGQRRPICKKVGIRPNKKKIVIPTF